MASPDVITVQKFCEIDRSFLPAPAEIFLEGHKIDPRNPKLENLPFIVVKTHRDDLFSDEIGETPNLSLIHEVAEKHQPSSPTRRKEAVIHVQNTPEGLQIPAFTTILFEHCTDINPEKPESLHAIISVQLTPAATKDTAFLETILEKLQLPPLTAAEKVEGENNNFTYANSATLLTSPLDLKPENLDLEDMYPIRQLYIALNQFFEQKNLSRRITDITDYRRLDYTDLKRLIYLYGGLQFLRQQAKERGQSLQTLLISGKFKTIPELQAYWKSKEQGTENTSLLQDATMYIKDKKIPLMNAEIIGPQQVTTYIFAKDVTHAKIIERLQEFSGEAIPKLDDDATTLRELDQAGIEKAYLLENEQGKTVRIVFSRSSGYCARHEKELLESYE